MSQKKKFSSASSIAESPVVRVQSGSVDLICVFSLHSDSMFQVLNSLSLNPEDINIGYVLCSFSCEPSSPYYIFLVRPRGSSLMCFMCLRTLIPIHPPSPACVLPCRYDIQILQPWVLWKCVVDNSLPLPGALLWLLLVVLTSSGSWSRR